MTCRTSAIILVLASALALPFTAAAQDRPTIAIVPTQYFRSDAQNAELVTRSLVERFEAERYHVIPMDRSRQTFERMRLTPERPISDETLAQFGRRLGADLVARPQLLAVRPWHGRGADTSSAPEGRAVLYLRVLNAHTGNPLYTRQVAYPFTTAGSDAGNLIMPPSAAAEIVAEVTRQYFERVAGSRQEYRTPAGR
jgi:hypothetical protein